jgi:hypothetical protein
MADGELSAAGDGNGDNSDRAVTSDGAGMFRIALLVLSS